MTAIERTAYPRLHRNPTEQDLAAIYTPTEAELAWVPTIARDAAHRLHLLLWLKCFQRLGYFPDLLTIPTPISDHLRAWLPRDADVPLGYSHARFRYRHQLAVRNYLGVRAYDNTAQDAISTTLRTTAAVLDNPADLINVALEELVRLRYELPAFSTLDHLVEHIRTAINQALFTQVTALLTPEETAGLQALLDTKLATRRTTFQTIKEPAQNATLGHLRDLERKLAWLLTLVDADRLLAGVPSAKAQHFAAQAQALDAGAMNDINPVGCENAYGGETRSPGPVLTAQDIHVIKTPFRTPTANAYAERWIGSARRECLDKLLILNEAHLRRVLQDYIGYYNKRRPHQGIEQRSPIPIAEHRRTGTVQCHDVLGGILHDYERAA